MSGLDDVEGTRRTIEGRWLGIVDNSAGMQENRGLRAESRCRFKKHLHT